MGHVMTGFPWMWWVIVRSIPGYLVLHFIWRTEYYAGRGLVCAACLLSWQQRRILWLLLPPLLFVTGYGLQQKCGRNLANQ